ncbi:MAG: cation diffusion facilitator family transporter [Flavobacteriaceae bacterium]|nr:cation diffusion facilitator family transporter [Flavobacteriaceae bacterium]
MGSSHSHTHKIDRTVKERNLFISILLNILITLAQIIGGILSGSLALLSDALHNFSDVLSLVVSYIASKISKRKASFSKTFGYKRAEILAAFINASTLVIVAILLIIEAYHRFKDPQVIDSSLVIWLSLVAIFANGFSVLLLKKDSHSNINIKSAYIHLLTDMMASIAVLIGGLLMQFYRIYWVDSLLTLIIALYLIWVGFDLLKTSTKILMLFTPEQIDIRSLVKNVHKIPRVKKLHHIHVWGLNDDEIHLEAHLDVDEDISLSEFDEILHRIEKLLYDKYNINHVTLQPEYNKPDSKDIIVQD